MDRIWSTEKFTCEQNKRQNSNEVSEAIGECHEE